MALGDKLSNIRSLYGDYKRVGERIWQRFNMKDKEKQGWYYRGLCDSLADLVEFPEYAEFCDLVDRVFGNVIAE